MRAKTMFPYRKLTLFVLSFIVFGCGRSADTPDAFGYFEAEETIVSAEVNGKLIEFNIEEGQSISEDEIIGQIDTKILELQKEQISASITAVESKTLDPNPQIAVLRAQRDGVVEQVNAARSSVAVSQEQLKVLEREQQRIQKLVADDVIATKQLDDINGQVDILKKQIETQRKTVEAQEKQLSVINRQIQAQTSTITTQNEAVLSEVAPLEKRIEQVDDQIDRASLKNPKAGTVLAKYARAGEITAFGKPLYKIADVTSLVLRAYISGEQLSQVKLGQTVRVYVDGEEDTLLPYEGRVEWVSDTAEFTPKTVLTKEERTNLVYAIKIRVQNPEGLLKIGMPAEVLFKIE